MICQNGWKNSQTILLDDRVPVHRDAPASSSRESASELRKVDTHFPNDRNCLEPTRKPKVIYTDNSLEFGKACAELFWNLCTSTPQRSETNGIGERVVRRMRKLLQSGLDEKWWADSMECKCFSAKHSRSLV